MVAEKLERTDGDPGADAQRTARHSLASPDFVDPFKARAEKDQHRKLEAQKRQRAVPAFNAFAANAPAPDPFRKADRKVVKAAKAEKALLVEPAVVGPLSDAPVIERAPAPVATLRPAKSGRKPVASAAPAVEPETDDLPEIPAGVLAAFAASRGASSRGGAMSAGAMGLAGLGDTRPERVLRADVVEKPRADAPRDNPDVASGGAAAGEAKRVKAETVAPTTQSGFTEIPQATTMRGMAAKFFGPKVPDTGKRAASLSERGADSVVDDIVVWVLTGVLILLIGWAFFTYGPTETAAPGKIVKPQSVSVPAPTPKSAPALKKADPFPADRPVDLRPQSVLPAEPVAPAATPTAAALAPAPVRDDLPVAGSCPSGRVVRSLFCTKSTFLTAEGRAQLEKDVAQWRACGGDRTFVVRGYADTRGTPALNRSLAEGRAASVAAVLKLAGLRASAPEGVGELADLPDGQNCPNQRRVDVFLGDENPAVSRACTPPEEMAALVCP